ncbi:hypothetical protein CEXT_114661 [Caerostris extrusa]|uniref:Uncharacterized protein n=1 Tax=Caerostris extrusa TaxID=172846 RepID=A0AAV4X796_CAEEX|nr:hypothetical protein CEXT_114661 [Caerostris extrusa]
MVERVLISAVTDIGSSFAQPVRDNPAHFCAGLEGRFDVITQPLLLISIQRTRIPDLLKETGIARSTQRGREFYQDVSYSKGDDPVKSRKQGKQMAQQA